MIIYCDESGGKGDDVFLVAAVPDFPKGTDRPIRNIRRILRIKDEVKGHSLSDQNLDRALKAFDYAGLKAIIAILRRQDPVHRKIMNRNSDERMWEELIFQAVAQIYDGSDSQLTVIVDGGRYENEVVNNICNSLTQRFCNQLGINHVNVESGDSRNFSGLQIADLASNKTYRVATRLYKDRPIIFDFAVAFEEREIIRAPRLLFEKLQQD